MIDVQNMYPVKCVAELITISKYPNDDGWQLIPKHDKLS